MDSLEAFDIGGSRQWALIRGRNETAPVLLLIQAGPGLSIIHEADAHQRQLGLEEHFRVVYWDQRGTGRSLVAQNGPITIADLVADVRAMIRACSERLGVPGIHVAGFSIGAAYALLAASQEPERVRSLVCVGPDVNLLEAERCAWDFARGEAVRRGNQSAMRALHEIGAPPHRDMKRFMTRVKWVTNFGGVHRGKTFFGLMGTVIARMWRSPHYSIPQMVRALGAMEKTQAWILPALQGLDLLADGLQAKVPVAIFQGRHDYAAPPPLSAELAARLKARLVWFEESAHMPYEEEPGRFREELLRFHASLS